MKGDGRLSARLRRQVERRAGGRCEYCKIPLRFDALPPAVDHVVARQHGGRTEMANLAFCCAHCNAHKGPNIAGIDPNTKRAVRIFSPRTDEWASHFRWNGAMLIGLTPEARATIVVLAINDPFKSAARQALMDEGTY
ncbi:MAG TPA: HNH endonuclease signature motif containing protein [Tepidisphaeraceae bacterium]|nr:HNH endonuclease signature motif containing protein [Tepidisphaeraceae bacterium]